jgi:hypothetical protein
MALPHAILSVFLLAFYMSASTSFFLNCLLIKSGIIFSYIHNNYELISMTAFLVRQTLLDSGRRLFSLLCDKFDTLRDNNRQK